MTCFGWLIFRAQSVDQMFQFMRSILFDMRFSDVSDALVLVLLFGAVPLVIFQFYQLRTQRMEPWTSWPAYVRVPFYLFLFYGSVLFGAPVSNAFIYFQF